MYDNSEEVPVEGTPATSRGEPYRMAFELAAHATLILDSDGMIVDANAELERMLEQQRSELLGRPLELLFDDRSREACRAALHELPACEHVSRELVARRRTGAGIPTSLRLRRLPTSLGERALCTLIDQQVTRELTRSNTDLEHFVSTISHDLQEPVRMVTSYMRLLAEDYREQLDDTARLYIHFAQGGAEHMQCLIRDLLALSRVGTHRRSDAEISVTECFAFAVSGLQDMIEECEAVVSSDPLPMVMGDRTQLIELLQNLIGNALKFRRGTPPEVHVSAEVLPGAWQLSVRDNGIGIAPEHVDEVFRVFRRLHGRDEYAGTGIGLAICKRIVEQRGGKIWIESKPGEGSHVYVQFPNTVGTAE